MWTTRWPWTVLQITQRMEPFLTDQVPEVAMRLVTIALSLTITPPSTEMTQVLEAVIKPVTTLPIQVITPPFLVIQDLEVETRLATIAQSLAIMVPFPTTQVQVDPCHFALLTELATIQPLIPVHPLTMKLTAAPRDSDQSATGSQKSTHGSVSHLPQLAQSSMKS